ESVAAEVVVFLFLGRPLLNRIGPRGAALLAAVAGMLRWGVEAETAGLPAMALIQPLHGITFALLHLGCMQRLAERVPPRLPGTGHDSSVLRISPAAVVVAIPAVGCPGLGILLVQAAGDLLPAQSDQRQGILFGHLDGAVRVDVQGDPRNCLHLADARPR